MGFSRNQVLAVIMAVVMFGSMFVGLTFNSPQQGPPNPLPPQGGSPTSVPYEAPGVKGVVQQVFPSGALVATTTEFDVPSIESKLRGIPGVVSVSKTLYLEEQAKGEAASIRADIRLESPEKAGEAIEAIRLISSFPTADIFLQAVVSMPQEVEFKNSSLGLSQNYSFPEKQVPAFVSSSTMKGDEVIVRISASFTGKAASNVFAYEAQNLTSSPRIFAVDRDFTIASLDQNYLVSAKTVYSEQKKLEEARPLLEALSDSSAELEIRPSSYALKVFFAEPSKVFPQDLNSFFSSLDGVDSFTVSPENEFAEIAFSPAADFASFRETLRTGLESIGFAVKSIEEPSVFLQGMLVAGDRQRIVSGVAQVAQKNSLEIDLLRSARIDANELFVPDANQSFPLKEGFFNAFVKPTRSAGDTVKLSVFIVASNREGIIEANAKELVEEEK